MASRLHRRRDPVSAETTGTYQRGTMTRFGIVALLAALVATTAVLSSDAQAEDADKCGGKGQESCPLQGWMEKNIDGPMEKKDFAALEKGLTKVATLVPDPKWNEGDKGWATIAKAGAAAAKAKDMDALKASCKSCHKAWRKKYKAEFRMRPVK